MKIQTNAGEVELTAEMVCRGMVFQSHGREPFAVTNPVTLAGFEPAEWWETTESGGSPWRRRLIGAINRGELRFLGCDPTIASRADCERYGVHGDAAAHGFAKIPAGGAIDLTVAENIRKGMLFRINGREVVAACDAQFAVAGSTRLDLLGCHPALARREDCERFGIPERCEQFGEDAPLDAGAHGFARLKTGGAVDLRKVPLPMGAVVLDTEFNVRGTPIDCEGPWQSQPLEPEERFVGLNARHASPADVERLCCGAEDPDNFVPGQTRCTLAIGDHDTHEDIATGAKWPAEHTVTITSKYKSDAATFADRPLPDHGEMRFSCGGESFAVQCDPADVAATWFDAPPLPPCAKCGGSVGGIMNAVSVDLPCAAGRAEGWRWTASVCKACATIVGANLGAYEIRDGRIVTRAAPEKARGFPPLSGIDVPPDGIHRRAPTDPALLGAVSRFLTEQGTRGPTEAQGAGDARRQREAPLLALVAAVPEGLDPIGWRAGLAALTENRAGLGRMLPDGLAAFMMTKANRIVECIKNGSDPASHEATGIGTMLRAYRRAIAPHRAPPPERKQRGPRLTVDDGREDE